MSTTDGQYRQQTAHTRRTTQRKSQPSNGTEDDAGTQDYEYRRKLQNRLAQRRYRERLKQRGASRSISESSRATEQDQPPQERATDWSDAEEMSWDTDLMQATGGALGPVAPYEGDVLSPIRGLSNAQNSSNFGFPSTTDPQMSGQNIRLDAFWLGAQSKPAPTSSTAASVGVARLEVDVAPRRHETNAEGHKHIKEPQNSLSSLAGAPNSRLTSRLSNQLPSHQQGQSRVRRVRPKPSSCNSSTPSEASLVSTYKDRLNDKASHLIQELMQLYGFGVDLEMLQYDVEFIEQLQHIPERFAALSLAQGPEAESDNDLNDFEER